MIKTLSRINCPENSLLVCTKLWNLALKPPSLETNEARRNFFINRSTPTQLAQTLESGPDTTNSGNEKLVKGPPYKCHQSTMLAQNLKSGPEATKPGNERFVKGFPSKSSQSTMLAQTLKSGLTQCLSGKPIFPF